MTAKTRKPKWQAGLYFTTIPGTWQVDEVTKKITGTTEPLEWCRQNNIEHRLEVIPSDSDRLIGLGKAVAIMASTFYLLKFRTEADAMMCKLMFSHLDSVPYEYDE